MASNRRRPILISKSKHGFNCATVIFEREHQRHCDAAEFQCDRGDNIVIVQLQLSQAQLNTSDLNAYQQEE